jgi:hypothetical protein
MFYKQFGAIQYNGLKFNGDIYAIYLEIYFTFAPPSFQ